MWNLRDLGFGPSMAAAYAPFAGTDSVAARVAAAHREQYVLYSEQGELRAGVAGRLRHAGGPLPATGDWVVARPGPAAGQATILAVLPARTRLTRKVAGHVTREQVIAANVDVVLLVAGLDGDFNVRRLERALVAAWDSGAVPAIVLNKADLCADVQARRQEVASAAPGVAVHVVSGVDRRGLDALAACVPHGGTAVLLGSSGVGKTTLTNALVGGSGRATQPVRAHDSRGRHTTTTRELIALPTGGWMIDTPGLRELQLWSEADAAAPVFDELAAVAARCRFRDCRHASEPGCAVRAAVEMGEIDRTRLESYAKLQRELRHLAARQDESLRQAEKQKWRAIHRAAAQLYRTRNGGKRGGS